MPRGSARLAIFLCIAALALLLAAVAGFALFFGADEPEPRDSRTEASRPAHRPEDRPAASSAPALLPQREEAALDARDSEFDPFDAATFEIEGRVVNQKKEPIAGATIRLFVTSARLPSTAYLDAFRTGGLVTFERARRTGPDGKFTIRGPFSEGNDYTLWAAAREFAPSTIHAPSVEGGHTCNLGDVTLDDGLEIAGTVFDSLGNPLPSGRVGIVASPTDMAIERFVEQTEPEDFLPSDEQGQFRLPHLVEGRYTVIAWAPGYARGASAPILLSKERPSKPVELHLALGDSIGGIIQNVEGVGIPDARVKVKLMSRDNPEASFPQELEDSRFFDFPISVATGPDGAFEIEGLVAGMNYQIQVTAKDHRSSSGRAAAGDMNVHMVLRPDFQVRGVVVDKENGAPVGGARVAVFRGKLNDLRGGQWAMPQASQTTDSGGQFVARDAGTPGNATILAWAPGYAPALSEPFVLKDGEPPPETKVVIERGAAIAGTVMTSSTKEPIGNAVVSLFFVRDPTTGGNPQFRIGAYATKTTTDANGHFTLDGLLGGAYVVEARHTGFGGARSDVMIVQSTEQRAGVQIEMSRPGTIRGVVSGAPAGTSVRVLATRQDGLQFATFADVDNRFAITKLGPGYYQVRAERINSYEELYNGFWRKGIGQGSVPVQIRDGDGVDLLLEVPDSRFGKLIGTIVDSGGPGTGYTLVLTADTAGQVKTKGQTNPTFGSYKTATADVDGSFEFATVTEGSYRVYAIPRGRALVPKNAVASDAVQIFSNAVARRDLYGQSGMLKGRVTRQDGGPVRNARVVAQVNGTRSPNSTLPAGTQFTTTSNRNGYFDFGRLPGGAYDLTIEAPGFTKKTVASEVYSGAGEPLRITLESPSNKPRGPGPQKPKR